MKNLSDNHYERAFENWLIDHKIEYVVIDEYKTAEFGHPEIKSFDFLLHLNDGQIVITEVKGRSYRGITLKKLAGFECWVTSEDIEGLVQWQKIFGEQSRQTSAVIVFAYKVENIDVDFDGMEFFEFDSNRYIFFCARLDDYRKFMRRRSPKWKTVTLPADKFRKCAVQFLHAGTLNYRKT